MGNGNGNNGNSNNGNSNNGNGQNGYGNNDYGKRRVLRSVRPVVNSAPEAADLLNG